MPQNQYQISTSLLSLCTEIQFQVLIFATVMSLHFFFFFLHFVPIGWSRPGTIPPDTFGPRYRRHKSISTPDRITVHLRILDELVR